MRRPTRVRTTLRDWKVMMIVAFHRNRVLGYQILARNVNVDNNVYLEFLRDVVARAVRQYRIRRPCILHDNARPHKHQNVKAFFRRHRWEELKHPPYSPDLNPCDFNGIARIKRPNKGRRFNDEAGLVAAYEAVIEEINQNETATGIQHLPQRWEQVIQTGGEYIVE